MTTASLVSGRFAEEARSASQGPRKAHRSIAQTTMRQAPKGHRATIYGSMVRPTQAPVDVDLLTSMAKRFANHDMYEEAAELFEIAQRLEPQNRGVKLGLAQIRQQMRAEEGHDGRGKGRSAE